MSRIVKVDVAATVLFVAGGAAALASSDVAKYAFAPLAFTYAGAGVVLFLWAYAKAIERSRTSEIAVSQLYFVSGEVAPPAVKRALRGSLWTQIVVALVVMVAGFSRTKPSEFNWAATAVIVPLLGFGLNGVWVARFGTFSPRILTERPRKEQNSRHG